MAMPEIRKTKEDPNEAPQEQDLTHDAVFGEITDEGPNYRNVGFLGTVILMMKTQIGLGVLSIPTALDILGLVPGIICICVIAAVTTWSGYIIGIFKLNHREVYGIDDAGGLIFGPLGRWTLSLVFCLYWIFVSGSGILGISISLNAVSSHGACTAIFVAISAILGFTLSSVRTLGKITWLAWIGLPSILVSIIVVTVAVGLQDRPPTAPPTDTVWVSDYKVVGHPSFTEAITAVSALVFAFSGTPGFFAIVSEMRNPRQYTWAVIACQTGVTTVYAIIGSLIYYYCGSNVASPALGSAGGTVKKVCYGLALPGLMVTTTIVTHIPAKYIFIHLLRGSRHLTRNTVVHWSVWLGCTFGVTVVAYIIASAIPIFNSLVSLIGAFLGTLLCFQPMGCMWLYDHWTHKNYPSERWYFMVCWSIFVIVVGTFLMVGGTYGSVVGIIDSYNASGGSSAFSCADNSNSS
ncbi:putative amino acid transporter [Aspergillus avenaceus]|uniref:Putative amino acid transporter n=1 Tax=Aspergillus avenaceus TaxID=36643 RepID=A0A5N6TE35_ASPAV|nr:putative amino acid transporter [Aspergillus avenaceus]